MVHYSCSRGSKSAIVISICLHSVYSSTLHCLALANKIKIWKLRVRPDIRAGNGGGEVFDLGGLLGAVTLCCNSRQSSYSC